MAAAQRDLARAGSTRRAVLDEARLERRAAARGSSCRRSVLNSSTVGLSAKTLYWMRRRNASSTSSAGLMLVAKTTSVMNGSSNFWPRLQRQVVDPALERHDPAVQQVARRALLPAEVVDDQHAAVGDGLHGRAIEAGRRAVAQLERVERQLAADHDHRTPAAHPAPVADARGRGRPRRRVGPDALRGSPGSNNRMMLPFDLDRVRDRDVAVEQIADRLRDDRLAVSGRAVDEHRVAGVDGRAELVEHAVADDQMRERLLERVPRRAARRVAR